MLDKMKKLMEMKKQADQIKRQLDGMVMEVDDVRGIKITITGSQNFQSLEIDENLLGPQNKSRLESELLKSINAAIKKSQRQAAQSMASLMPGL
ncbi:MAG: YbaB/EbfC family nucleoid-associated protein [Candidatus Omnitrophica bacterium]|nr:YbaB/EbfC family nucleoid-associated protein [Candidatus Omnitrophota bacterium]